MNKHHKAILALLNRSGKNGAYNYELVKITPRFSARLEELRDGRADGFCHNIETIRVSTGLFKYVKHDEPLTPEAAAMIDAILEPAMPEPESTLKPGEGKAMFRQKLKEITTKDTYEITEDVVKLKHKIIFAQGWLETNPNHPQREDAVRRYQALEQKYNEIRGING